MSDIARELGVSPATVSLALAGRPVVAESTRRKIEQKAAEMGYRKNPLVAALMRSRRSQHQKADSPVLAYLNLYPERDGHKTSLLPDYFPAAASGEATRMGFRLERFWIRDPAISQRRLCDMLYARGIGCVLVGSCPTEGFELDLDWARFCWTSLTLAPRMPELDHIGSDHFGIMSETLRRVIGSGYRRIGLMMRHSGTCAVTHAWIGAYFAGMHEDIESVAVLAVRHLVFLTQGNETGIPPVARSIRIPGRWNHGATA